MARRAERPQADEDGHVATTYDALLLVSFGGPEGPDEVVPFLERVTAGRGIPRERLAEVGEHYFRFGGVSPIQAQNRRLLAALRATLPVPVYWGNRNSRPFLADTVREMRADGVRRAAAFVTSAYSSYSGCRQYREDIARAQAEVGEGAPAVDKLRVFHDHPGFVEPFVDGTAAALAEAGPGARLVFTAHSVPASMAATSAYEAQLLATAGIIADRLGHRQAWDLVWQSRSGPPQVPWLAPDVNDHLRELYADGVRAVVLVPIGFVSDHMEVVFDLDTEAVQTAATLPGLTLVRATTPATEPDQRFVAMVGELLTERAQDWPAAERPTLWPERGPCHDVCPLDCCPAPTRPGVRRGDPLGQVPVSARG